MSLQELNHLRCGHGERRAQTDPGGKLLHIVAPVAPCLLSTRECTPDLHLLSGWLMFSRFCHQLSEITSTAVRRHCTDWYEIWALTDHEIYYIKIELDLRKFSIGPFSETEKGFWVNPTPGGSQCTGLSPTLSWKRPRATLSPSFGPFFERSHSFGVKIVSENVWKWLKNVLIMPLCMKTS